MISKSCGALPFRNRADAGSIGHVGDAASVGLNRQWHSNPVRDLSQCDESNHGRLKNPFSVAPKGALLFHLGSYAGAETAPSSIRSPGCGLKIDSRF